MKKPAQARLYAGLLGCPERVGTISGITKSNTYQIQLDARSCVNDLHRSF